MHPTTARVFHSTVASPQPTRPSSVCTLTNTQLRISAPTTTVESPVIFILNVQQYRRRRLDATRSGWSVGSHVLVDGDLLGVELDRRSALLVRPIPGVLGPSERDVDVGTRRLGVDVKDPRLELVDAAL